LKNKNRLISCALGLFFIVSVGATLTKAADTHEQTVKKFYTWYLKRIITDKSPRNEKAVFQKSVSKRLSRWYYSRAYEEYGADYFIDAQNSDDEWRVTTGKAIIKRDTATLKVKLAAPNTGKNGSTQNLTVKLVKEEGVWKINSVNNRKLTAWGFKTKEKSV